MSENTKPRAVSRRRTLLIEPRFQIPFLVYTISGALLSSVIFFGSIQYFFWKFAEYGRKLGFPDDHIFFRFLASERWQLNWIFLGTVLIVTALMTGYGLFFSNRIAGPIYRLKKHFCAIGIKGTAASPRLGFRKGDFFSELGPIINDALLHDKENKRAG